MKTIQQSALLVVVLFATMSAVTADTFEDVATGFVFELPEGYYEKQRDHRLGMTVFKFGGENQPELVVSAIPIETGFDDNAEIFEMLMEPVEEVFGGPTTIRELSEFEIGSMPARWGWMERALDELTVMIAGVGVVEMDDLQVAFSIAMPESQFSSLQTPFETSFLSIREPGQAIGAVSDKVAVERVVAESAVLEPSTYEHPLFRVDLPAGWQATTNSTEAKSINLATLEGPTGNVTVLCMSGFLANKKTMGEAMYGSLSSNLPNLNQVGGEKAKAKNGKKTEIKWYKAQTEARGDTVMLDGVTASVKNGKCMLGFVAISPETANDQRVNEIVGIVKSVH